jgi:hypothetical protein
MNPLNVLIATVTLSVFLLASCKEKSGTSGQEQAAKTIQAELSQEEIARYTETGKSIAKSTFTALSGELKKALQDGAVEDASKYCNLVAIPLTDSLSTVHNASIKRTSLKLRNPENEPTQAELDMLNTYQARFASNEELQPEVKRLDDGNVQFYAPILTQQLCLTCHGTVGQELARENYQTLKSMYPEDQATGYGENDFRGMWSITFDQSKISNPN